MSDRTIMPWVQPMLRIDPTPTKQSPSAHIPSSSRPILFLPYSHHQHPAHSSFFFAFADRLGISLFVRSFAFTLTVLNYLKSRRHSSIILIASHSLLSIQLSSQYIIMMYQQGLQALAFTAILLGSASAQFTNSTGNSSTPAGSAVLDPANIQIASTVDGQAAAGAAPGQVASLTLVYHDPRLGAIANQS